MTGLRLNAAWISLQLAGVKREGPSDTFLKPLIFQEVNQTSFFLRVFGKFPCMFFLPGRDLNSLIRNMFLFPHSAIAA